MILSYLKLALRLLMRNPFFTMINVTGLAVGFAVFFVLWQHSQSELTSDRQWKDWDRIYRFGIVASWTDDKVNWEGSTVATNDAAFTAQVADQYSQVEDFTRIFNQKNFSAVLSLLGYLSDHDNQIYLTSNVNNEIKSFIETNLAYADVNLFRFFSIDLIRGNPSEVLTLAGSIVLSEKLAIKYFGKVDCVGETLTLNESIALRVTGVFRGLPANTHLDFDAVLSSERLKNAYSQARQPWRAPHCYLKLKEGANVSALNNKINIDLAHQIQEVVWGKWPHGKASTYFQPLSEMPFQSYRWDHYVSKSKVVLLIQKYSAIAILLLAWINYVNLVVAANRKRLKEVATRKTIGAMPKDLMLQFVIESGMVNFIAILLAFTLIQLIKSSLQSWLGFYIPAWGGFDLSTFAIASIALLIAIGLTGCYPAILTLTQSPRSLFSPFIVQRSSPQSQNILPVLQFTIAVVVLVLVCLVSLQLNHVLNGNIGIDKNAVLVVDLPIKRSADFKTQLKAMVNEIRKVKGDDVTVSQSVPGDDNQQHINLVTNTDAAGLALETNGGVDEYFFSFYNIELLTGRSFLSDSPADSNSVMISEAGVKRLGFASNEDAVGSEILVARRSKITIIGVFKDYKLQPLLSEGYLNYGGNPGLALTYKDYVPFAPYVGIPQRISVRVNAESYQAEIEFIKNLFADFFPGQVFNSYFLDGLINGKYRQQVVARNQIGFFAILTVCIACMGFLGMISNKAVVKTKEIGVRKILGARLYQIAQLLLNTTVRQVLVASAIGIPVAYYLTRQYLLKFSDRIELQWWYFVMPIALLVPILLATVASVVLKAATSNPVEALKHE
ncbi:MAG: ABC transporter permease [Cyclobacteriaceae bacterium]